MTSIADGGSLSRSRSSNSYDLFKLAGNGEPMLIETKSDLDAAISRVIGLRENFPGHYLVVSRATGKRIFFTAQGALRRT